MTDQQQRCPTMVMIVRPACPKCAHGMMLARIEPHSPHYDKRTFECPACEHSLIEVVKYT